MDVADLIKSEAGANVALMINASDLRKVVTDIVRDERERVAKEERERNELACISRSEASEMLGVSSGTLWRWNKIGYLKTVKVGYKTLYRRTDIENMLKEAKGGRI